MSRWAVCSECLRARNDMRCLPLLEFCLQRWSAGLGGSFLLRSGTCERYPISASSRCVTVGFRRICRNWAVMERIWILVFFVMKDQLMNSQIVSQLALWLFRNDQQWLGLPPRTSLSIVLSKAAWDESVLAHVHWIRYPR